MSLLESKGVLSKATKDLFNRWSDVKSTWSDAQSQEFEKLFITLIDQDVRQALGAMDHMNAVLQKIESDCE